jgi:beta-galactosidase
MSYIEKDFILFGGDYNPEQWDEATMLQDMEYFKEAHINTLVIGVFSWAKSEKCEAVYDFSWLDHILDILDDNGFQYILATPTSAQPAWLSKQYPEVLPVDISGRKRTHGMRVFFCVNSPKYRERAAAIAEKMAERYKERPGLLGWHVANEYGTSCYCDTCQEKFREWLIKKYKTIENINEKWTTAFWGRTLYSFDEIMLPTELNDDYRFNPAVELDYQRFKTDSTIDCYLNEHRILKKATPDLPVFTNISGFIKKIDQFKMVPVMDVAGWDNYPRPGDERSLPALKHDIMRASKDGQSYFVAEQSPAQQNWQPYNKLKRPGEVRRIAYQGLAHGADSSLFFQMRQSTGGQEKMHGALISRVGHDNTRTFREMRQLGEELSKLGNRFISGKKKAKVAVMFDWDCWRASELCSGPTQDIDYLGDVHHFYKPFYYKNIPVDVVKTSSSLDEYEIVIAPLLFMVTEDLKNNLEAFVKKGGTLFLTYLSGYVDSNDRSLFGAYPGQLRDLAGIWVEETDALFPNEKNSIRFLTAEKRAYSSDLLCDVLHTEGAETLAVFEHDFYAGSPAVTLNHYGTGKTYYIAGRPEYQLLDDLFDIILEEKNISPVFESSGEVEIQVREKNTQKTYFIINYSSEEAIVDLKNMKLEDLLHGGWLSGSVSILAGDVLILGD